MVPLCFCHLRADYRLFKMARMRNVEILSESFSRETPKKIFSEKQTIPEKQIELTRCSIVSAKISRAGGI